MSKENKKAQDCFYMWTAIWGWCGKTILVTMRSQIGHKTRIIRLKILGRKRNFSEILCLLLPAQRQIKTVIKELSFLELLMRNCFVTIHLCRSKCPRLGGVCLSEISHMIFYLLFVYLHVFLYIISSMWSQSFKAGLQNHWLLAWQCFWSDNVQVYKSSISCCDSVQYK